jgi:hypothetical protein
MILSESVRNGLLLGAAVALVQSLITIAALRWALNRPCFYKVWLGGILFRVLVLVSGFTQIHVTAALLSLVAATTVFLMVEIYSLKTG